MNIDTKAPTYNIGDEINTIEVPSSPPLKDIGNPEGTWWGRELRPVLDQENGVSIVYGKYTLREGKFCDCVSWCGSLNLGKYTHPHHQNCEHFDEEVVCITRVSLDGSSYYEHNLMEITQMMRANEDGMTFENFTMKKEVFEGLPEFEGF